MMSFACDIIWPIRLDLSTLECRQILREKELLCYSDVVSVLRAQGPLTDDKRSLLNNLQRLFSISDERNRAEIRRAANNEKLATIAETVSGFDAYAEWTALGTSKLPTTKRPIPRSAYFDEACQTIESHWEKECELPAPSSTKNVDLSKRLDDLISCNRKAKKDERLSLVNVATITDNVTGVSSLDYNLHLLSEIATGETVSEDIVEDIDHETATSLKGSETPTSPAPMVIGNNAGGQRYVFPRSKLPQRQPVANFVTHQQAQSGTYLTLIRNQILSPPPQQMGTARTTQPQTQQVFIQNMSSRNALGLEPNLAHHTLENLTSLGYTLQQRAVKADQQQSNNKQNFIVRNLGSQPPADAERNKRFMVVKGNSGGNSLGPISKKPKMTNPSNRQPGRPPLMPAPSSAYANRPYVTNEIFQANRTSTNATSSITDSVLTDSNDAKIYCVNSAYKSIAITSSNSPSNPYYSVNRPSGLQRTCSTPNSGSVVQLGSGCNLRSLELPSSGISNALRPKNTQPAISVVPLSPKRTEFGDNCKSWTKEDNIEHQVSVKDSSLPAKVINKEELFAKKMDRVNAPSVFSLGHTANKTQ